MYLAIPQLPTKNYTTQANIKEIMDNFPNLWAKNSGEPTPRYSIPKKSNYIYISAIYICSKHLLYKFWA